MTVFLYKATDVRRRAIEGTIAADSPHQAREQLRAQGVRILRLESHQAPRRRPGWLRPRAGRYAVRVAGLMRELATLLSAGIPLLESLGSIAGQQKGKVRAALVQLRERVAGGASLAEAMADQPDVFESLCVHMVEVGENSGTLETVLGQWADFRDRSLLLKDRVTTALLYPAFVFLVGTVVAVFLMTVILPMLLESLLEAGKTLPWPTRVAKTVSDVLVSHGWLVLALLIMAAGGVVYGLRTRRGKRWWHIALLHLPLMGVLASKQAISRIAFLIATLTKSGIPFLQAVEITSRSATNVVFGEALEDVAKSIRTGREIGPSLEQSGVFPASVVQIFSVGQESGQLDEMLQRLANDYESQVARVSERLTALLEPVMILVLAAFVGLILFATVLPILEAGNVM